MKRIMKWFIRTRFALNHVPIWLANRIYAHVGDDSYQMVVPYGESQYFDKV